MSGTALRFERCAPVCLVSVVASLTVAPGFPLETRLCLAASRRLSAAATLWRRCGRHTHLHACSVREGSRVCKQATRGSDGMNCHKPEGWPAACTQVPPCQERCAVRAALAGAQQLVANVRQDPHLKSNPETCVLPGRC